MDPDATREAAQNSIGKFWNLPTRLGFKGSSSGSLSPTRSELSRRPNVTEAVTASGGFFCGNSSGNAQGMSSRLGLQDYGGKVRRNGEVGLQAQARGEKDARAQRHHAEELMQRREHYGQHSGRLNTDSARLQTRGVMQGALTRAASSTPAARTSGISARSMTVEESRGAMLLPGRDERPPSAKRVAI